MTPSEYLVNFVFKGILEGIRGGISGEIPGLVFKWFFGKFSRRTHGRMGFLKEFLEKCSKIPLENYRRIPIENFPRKISLENPSWMPKENRTGVSSEFLRMCYTVAFWRDSFGKSNMGCFLDSTKILSEIALVVFFFINTSKDFSTFHDSMRNPFRGFLSNYCMDFWRNHSRDSVWNVSMNFFKNSPNNSCNKCSRNSLRNVDGNSFWNSS